MSYQIKIKSLKIHNFRAIQDLSISFDNTSNYFTLVGRNGVCKTSFLEALNIALSDNTSKFNNIKETDFYSDEPIEIEIEFDKYFYLLLRSDIVHDSYKRLIPIKKFKKVIKRRDRKEINQFFSPPYDIDFIPLIEEFIPSTAVFEELRGTIRQQYQEYHLVKSVRKENVVNEQGNEVTQYKYKTQSQTASEDGFPINTALLPYCTRIFFPKVFYFDKDRDREMITGYNTTFTSIVTELDWRYKKKILESKEEIKEGYNILHEKIYALDDYKKNILTPVKKTLSEHFGLDNYYKELDFFFFHLFQPYKNSIFGHMTEKEQLVSMDLYGSGITMLFAITLLINLAHQSKDPIIILVDEPELHLEPLLQKKLYLLLSKLDYQTFASTHSHLFITFISESNNLLFENIDGKVVIDKGNLFSVTDSQFRLLGNTITDLYIPENVLLVEGRYDKKLLLKCFSELKLKTSLQVLDCNGWTEIPDTVERIEAALREVLQADTWYSKYLKDNHRVKILVDGDVPTTKTDGWPARFSIPKENILRTDDFGASNIEYLYPESLVKECVSSTKLRTGEMLHTKTHSEIIKTILDDDELKFENKSQVENIVSKNRLGSFICNKIDEALIRSTENKNLLDLIQRII